jgi:multicomponent Na+:H+ antiporter subunit C
MEQLLATRFEYWVTAALMVVGFYGMFMKHNLVKKLIGLNIMQTAIILLFISMSVQPGGTVPIIQEGAPDAVYMSPLPHVLMLTAIVVMVGTSGVAFALLIRIHDRYGTLEEDDLLGRKR